MKKFITAIENGNLEELKTICKSDHHNHATRGGNIRDFINNSDSLPERHFNSLSDMQFWYEENVKYLFTGKRGFISRLESAFRQALNDGITNLTLSFGIDDKHHFESYKEFIDIIDTVHQSVASDISFIPEISFSRDHEIKRVEREFDEILELGFFKSIDLVGDDKQNVSQFKNIFQKAKKNSYTLRAHVGEFGDADSIVEAVKILSLDQVQHGISSFSSVSAIKYLRDANIQLNICPTSNIMLNRVTSYKDHPIKKLFHEGVKVTINSDDMLIFDQPVSQEYLNLYNSRCLSSGELDIIRLNGLQDRIN